MTASRRFGILIVGILLMGGGLVLVGPSIPVLDRLMVLVGRSSPEPTPVITSTPMFDGTPSPELAAIRDLGLEYWDAFNGYDLDRLLSYLEPTYRAERESTLKREVSLLRRFHVKLGITIESGPEYGAEDEAHMYIRLREPLGTRRVLMRFQRANPQWLITYAQEVE